MHVTSVWYMKTYITTWTSTKVSTALSRQHRRKLRCLMRFAIATSIESMSLMSDTLLSL
ncbi:hypothetical protein Plhal703r1_c24g0102371 [Plasmopara halstedii]